ncbi:Uncharacterized protein APZ42_029647 [Daphnia magna]|uniref:Uncharacterized protein n=1 Tax=Daphnia magna TaxID=35525 RepID=A0A164PFE4_9CRUS|nr:Uncharacterized protein APZ42_029647 [Daphnia magna]
MQDFVQFSRNASSRCGHSQTRTGRKVVPGVDDRFVFGQRNVRDQSAVVGVDEDESDETPRTSRKTHR